MKKNKIPEKEPTMIEIIKAVDWKIKRINLDGRGRVRVDALRRKFKHACKIGVQVWADEKYFRTKFEEIKGFPIEYSEYKDKIGRLKYARLNKIDLTNEQMIDRMKKAGFVVDVRPSFGYYSASSKYAYIEAKGGINRLYRKFLKLVPCPKCNELMIPDTNCEGCIWKLPPENYVPKH